MVYSTVSPILLRPGLVCSLSHFSRFAARTWMEALAQGPPLLRHLPFLVLHPGSASAKLIDDQAPSKLVIPAIVQNNFHV